MRTLRTERLVLRPYRPEDLDFLHELHSLPEVQRWIGDGAPQPERAQARTRLERYLSYATPSAEGSAHGIWAITDVEDAAPASLHADQPSSTRPHGTVPRGTLLHGTLLLKDIPASGKDGRPSGHTEIGWHLHPDSWGRGIATEAAAAVLAHAFESGLDHVVAVTHPENTASQVVARRIGMADQGLTRDFYDAECRLFLAQAP